MRLNSGATGRGVRRALGAAVVVAVLVVPTALGLVAMAKTNTPGRVTASSADAAGGLPDICETPPLSGPAATDPEAQQRWEQKRKNNLQDLAQECVPSDPNEEAPMPEDIKADWEARHNALDAYHEQHPVQEDALGIQPEETPPVPSAVFVDRNLWRGKLADGSRINVYAGFAPARDDSSESPCGAGYAGAKTNVGAVLVMILPPDETKSPEWPPNADEDDHEHQGPTSYEVCADLTSGPLVVTSVDGAAAPTANDDVLTLKDERSGAVLRFSVSTLDFV